MAESANKALLMVVLKYFGWNLPLSHDHSREQKWVWWPIAPLIPHVHGHVRAGAHSHEEYGILPSLETCVLILVYNI